MILSTARISRPCHPGFAPVILSRSPRTTEALALHLAHVLAPGDVITLSGELGSGKTTFVRGIARGLGYSGRVQSPTYTLAAHYATVPPLEHFDAYLGEKEQTFLAEGGAELLGGEGIALVEWPERIQHFLPEDLLEITFVQGESEEERILDASGTGPRGRELAAVLHSLAAAMESQGLLVAATTAEERTR